MSVSYGADSALISGTTSVTISSMPAGSVGDLLIVLCGSNHATNDAAVPTIDDGTYTQLFTYVMTGGGAQGAGTGNRRVTAWYKSRVAGDTTATPIISLTGGDVMGCNAWNFTKSLGNPFLLAYTNGEDTSDGTDLSITGAAGLDALTGDLILFGHVSNDSVTVTTEALTLTGATVGAVTEQLDSGTVTGNDLRVVASTANITAGSSNAAPVYTATLSAASQAGGFFIRISDRSTGVSQPIATVTETDTAMPITQAFPNYQFRPPTYQQYVPRSFLFPSGPRFALTESISVVRIGGVLTAVKSPSSEQLVGVEGTDFFRGGHVYTVTYAIASELRARGFTDLTML